MLVCDLALPTDPEESEDKDSIEIAHRICVVKEVSATDKLMDPQKYVETGFQISKVTSTVKKKK